MLQWNTAGGASAVNLQDWLIRDFRDDELIQKISSLFAQDAMAEPPVFLKCASARLYDVPWLPPQKQLVLHRGQQNIFWIKGSGALRIYPATLLQDVAVSSTTLNGKNVIDELLSSRLGSVDLHSASSLASLTALTDILGPKLDQILGQARVLKVIGSAESTRTLQHVTDYFCRLESSINNQMDKVVGDNKKPRGSPIGWTPCNGSSRGARNQSSCRSITSSMTPGCPN